MLAYSDFLDSQAFGVGLTVGLAVAFACGFASLFIAGRKHRSTLAFFIIGFLLGPLGMLVAVLVAPGESASEGMRAVICRRCNARQNIEISETQYECWQCKLSNSVGS
ncbi:hypothetical protein [Nocardia sp. NPDC127526]|uniref:hypothetical protein n=1 Tax=Nocardia sp. NPDC127526 TaxID=3345393 RepID=UPI003638D23F